MSHLGSINTNISNMGGGVFLGSAKQVKELLLTKSSGIFTNEFPMGTNTIGEYLIKIEFFCQNRLFNRV